MAELEVVDPHVEKDRREDRANDVLWQLEAVHSLGITALSLHEQVEVLRTQASEIHHSIAALIPERLEMPEGFGFLVSIDSSNEGFLAERSVKMDLGPGASVDEWAEAPPRGVAYSGSVYEHSDKHHFNGHTAEYDPDAQGIYVYNADRTFRVLLTPETEVNLRDIEDDGGD